MAVPFKEDNGGFNFGPIELTVLLEEFGKALVVEPYLSSVVMSGTILEGSNHPEKSSIIEKIISGEHQDLLHMPNLILVITFRLLTSVSKDADVYSLNGSKSFSTEWRKC